ncbi:MAG: helix-turn-helix transcriptional regulator [Crenarchaeota archaeon]|nr:helix-turn-helix transcriptional regulator [Thermoproteota archaeon]
MSSESSVGSEGAEELRELLRSPLANPVRLAIALYLLPRRGAYFSSIARALGITPGNLRHHLNVLIRHGIVEEKHVFSERPRKLITLTSRGAEELSKVLRLLKKLAEGSSER